MTTRYEYDSAGRLIREGNKAYCYDYLDKVMSVEDGKKKYSYAYHVDGQLAKADYGDRSEAFVWDGLALIQRGDEQFVNEPHIGGGNLVASSSGTTYFNDKLGTTIGVKKGGKYSVAALSAFGEDIGGLTDNTPSHPPFPSPHSPFFTGKPYVEGLGHAFLMRNYRADLAKWQTVDPMGYPDGWNAIAYCGNEVTGAVDLWGCLAKIGDFKSAFGYNDLPAEIVKYTMDGFTMRYDHIGGDIYSRGALRDHILVQGSVYVYYDDLYTTIYHAQFQDEQDVEIWGLYDCIATINRETLLSNLSKFTGAIGDIGGGLGLFLKTNTWYDAGMLVSSAIGKLEVMLKDETSVRLGEIYRLDDISTSATRSYDDFFKQTNKIKIVVE